MLNKVYILLDLVHVDSTKVAGILQKHPGVTMCDVLEGIPNLIVAVEGQDTRKTAECLINVLHSLDGITEDLRVLTVNKIGKKSTINAM